MGFDVDVAGPFGSEVSFHFNSGVWSGENVGDVLFAVLSTFQVDVEVGLVAGAGSLIVVA